MTQRYFMKILAKLLLIFSLFTSALIADVSNQLIDEKLYNSSIPIVDIRTPQEWREDGILKRAIPIMSWDEKGTFNQAFISTLQSKVDVTKPFALICRTGSRTHIVAAFLSDKLGYKVINLEGGMMYAKDKKFPIVHKK